MEYDPDAEIQKAHHDLLTTDWFSLVFPPFLASFSVMVAAVIADPGTRLTPLWSPESRGYFISCLMIFVAVVAWMWSFERFRASSLSSTTAHGFLVVASPTLFLPGRVGLVSVTSALIFVALFTGARAARLQRSRYVSVWLEILSLIMLVWLILAGIGSFHAQNRFGVLVAMATGLAVALTGVKSRSKLPDSIYGSLVICVMAAELMFALTFIELTPYTLASAWILFGILIIIASQQVWRVFQA